MYWLAVCFSFRFWSPVIHCWLMDQQTHNHMDTLLRIHARQDTQRQIRRWSDLCSFSFVGFVALWEGIYKTQINSESVWPREADRMQRAVNLVTLLVLGSAWILQAVPVLPEPLNLTQESFDVGRVSGWNTDFIILFTYDKYYSLFLLWYFPPPSFSHVTFFFFTKE